MSGVWCVLWERRWLYAGACRSGWTAAAQRTQVPRSHGNDWGMPRCQHQQRLSCSFCKTWRHVVFSGSYLHCTVVIAVGGAVRICICVCWNLHLTLSIETERLSETYYLSYLFEDFVIVYSGLEFPCNMEVSLDLVQLFGINCCIGHPEATDSRQTFHFTASVLFAFGNHWEHLINNIYIAPLQVNRYWLFVVMPGNPSDDDAVVINKSVIVIESCTKRKQLS